MSDTLRVLWTLVPQRAPQPWLHCSHCGDPKPFESSHKFRLNANGKRLDAWLIYHCRACGQTWNRPLLERRPAASVDPQLLAALQQNDPHLARHLAFDIEDLRRRSARIEACGGAKVKKVALGLPTRPAARLEIGFALAVPVSLRLDRLLAAELGLSRKRLHCMQDEGKLVVSPAGARRLKKPPRDGWRLALDLSQEDDRDAIAAAAR
ncbi:DUF1062 domain-containing protein [Pelagibius sp.]|uniref:DUF1062 domain-containing protein n=1 Tax=Pelagibius sp. TaxID=1931238 RepID=UPI00261FB57D|nr:DUF1062 domain-containing protein [Pelagibius sp.]